MDVLLLMAGIVLGAGLTYALLRGEIAARYAAQAQAERAELVQAYEERLTRLETQRENALAHARRAGADHSRAVLKGKLAEQMAPLLPGFAYVPADARFLGDPIDYVVFNGYSAVKEGEAPAEPLEIVLLDIKHGKSTLSQGQRRIAQAVAEGRVRFEVVRVYANGAVRPEMANGRPPRDATGRGDND